MNPNKQSISVDYSIKSEMGNDRRYAKLKKAVKCESLSVNVAALLKERAERIRIADLTFDGDPPIIGSECIDRLINDAMAIPEINPSRTLDRVGVGIFASCDPRNEFNEELLHWKLTQSKSARTMNHPIYRMSRADLNECILKGHVKHNFRRRGVSDSILEYVFYLMACHSSALMIDACYGTLEYHLQNSQVVEDKIVCWTPTVEDIISVFMNFGISKELLTSYDPLPSTSTSKEGSRDISPQIQMMDNFCSVMKYISSVLLKNKHQYDAKALDQLLLIFVTTSLDKVMCRRGSASINMEFYQCIRRILRSYSMSACGETGKVANLSNNLHSKLSSLCGSDYFFTCNFYLGNTSFGKKIHHALSYCFIKSAINPTNTKSYLDEVDVDDIRRILQHGSLLNIGYSTQYYIILNAEKMITSLSFSSDKKKKVARLRQLVSNLKIKCPNPENSMDYLQVKQLITTAYTAWKMGIREESQK